MLRGCVGFCLVGFTLLLDNLLCRTSALYYVEVARTTDGTGKSDVRGGYKRNSIFVIFANNHIKNKYRLYEV